MLEGSWPFKSFVSYSQTMHELWSRTASIGWLYERTWPAFVLCQVLSGVNPKIANKNMQQRTLPSFLTIPSTVINYGKTEALRLAYMHLKSNLAKFCETVLVANRSAF